VQEGFDPDHVALAVEGAIAQGLASESLVTVPVVFHWVGYFVRGGNDAEKPAAGGGLGCPIAIGQQAVTANVLEPVGQYMQQEAPDEFVDCQRHGLVCGPVFAILPSKRDIVAVEADEPIVGDGHTMGLATQIIEHVSGVAEGRFCIDHPLGLCRECEKGGECLNVGERFKLAVEMRMAGECQPKLSGTRSPRSMRVRNV